MTISKLKLAIGVVVVFLLGTSAAMATHTFSDVPDGQYYTVPVTWAFDNGITTGTSDTTFAPMDDVTRGQNVTFAYRYDQNIVQPKFTALDASIAALESDVATNTTNVATNTTDISDNASAIASNDSDIANLPDVYFIEVNAAGTKTDGSFGTLPANTGTGNYEIQFPVDDVNDCTWSGTMAQKGTGIGSFDTAGGEIYLQSDIDFTGLGFVRDIDSIFVKTSDSSGAAANRAFQVQITCGLPTLVFIPPILPVLPLFP